jgi:hypothetical protein
MENLTLQEYKIKLQEERHEELIDRTNQMAGIIGSYKALLQAAIEVAKGEALIGIDYLEKRQAEMIERIDELYK